MKRQMKRIPAGRADPVTGLMAALILVGLFWTPYDPDAMLAGPKLDGPLPGPSGWGPTTSAGTSSAGCCRGRAPPSCIALSTVAIGAVCGTAVGALTGYFGGVVDEVLMRLNDALTAFPSILLALVLISMLGPGNKYNVVIALGIGVHPQLCPGDPHRLRGAAGRELCEERPADGGLQRPHPGACTSCPTPRRCCCRPSPSASTTRCWRRPP